MPRWLSIPLAIGCLVVEGFHIAQVGHVYPHTAALVPVCLASLAIDVVGLRARRR